MRTKRTIALIVLACVVTTFAILAVLIASLGVVPGAGVGLLGALLVMGVYVGAIGPWQRRWGATDDEVARTMPGDDLLPVGAASTTRAITIDGAPGTVFQWLLQIGYRRGGWYSYDWIDNDGTPSIDRIDDALQHLTVGDVIEMLPGTGPVVRELERDHYIVSGGTEDSWCLLVEPTADGRTRLISRWRQNWRKSAGTWVWIWLSDPGAFLMERKMLRTIRDRVERHAHLAPTARDPSA